jgi:hypothetical protein
MAIVALALFDFDLDGRVGNVEVLLEHFGNGLLNPLCFESALLLDPNVQATGHDARGDGPNVQVMNILDADYSMDHLYDVGQIQSYRNRFHEDIDGLAQDAPGTPENQSADEQRHEWVNHALLRQDDDDACDNHAQGRKGIAQHVQVGYPLSSWKRKS